MGSVAGDSPGRAAAWQPARLVAALAFAVVLHLVALPPWALPAAAGAPPSRIVAGWVPRSENAAPLPVSIEIGPHDDPAHPDGRDSIVKLGPQLGLSPAEIDQIRKATGYVVCSGPADHPELTIAASAALLVSNQEIETNAHLFRDVVELQGREGLSRCFFQNQASDNVKDLVPVPLLDEPGSIVYNDDPSLNNQIESNAQPEKDYAVARLKSPVKDARPLAIDTSGAIMHNGEALIGISARQEGVQAQILGTQPIVQQIWVYGTPVPGSTTVYPMDSDIGGGSSGGANLMRINGVLTIKSIFAGGRGPWATIRRDGPGGGSWSVGLDGDFLKAVLDLDARYSKASTH